MSREDIADFLGLKKETVSRSFRQLEQHGLIERHGSHAVRIRDLSELRDLAGVRAPCRRKAAEREVRTPTALYCVKLTSRVRKV